MNFFKKWYTYQKERFPVLMYGTYILAIVFATYCYVLNTMRLITIDNTLIIAKQFKFIEILPIFAVTFLQFLMVRIIDEFKDYDEDYKFRPYRPVPRGLISLKELKVLFTICVILQVIITCMVNPFALIYLLLVWTFFAVMSKSFFIKKIVDKHVLLEVALDELLMPILILYISKFIGFVNPIYSMEINISFVNLIPFMIMTYIVSWVVEVARKIRSKEQEEKGVKTYTAVFGINKAILLLTILEVILAFTQYTILGKSKIIIIILELIIISIININFVKKKDKKSAKITELFANIYIFIVYVSLFLLII